MIITKPGNQEYAAYYQQYINKVSDNDLLKALEENKEQLVKLAGSVPADKADFRYAVGKWSIKEVLSHMSDTERIFAYRALRFARNDKAPLTGFDEEEYAPESNASGRTIGSITDELLKVREATIALFSSFSEPMFMRNGTANNNVISVSAIGFIITGHAIHHMDVISEKYLSPSRSNI